MKDYNIKGLYIQVTDSKVTKLIFPFKGEYTEYLENKETLNKFIIQLNYILFGTYLTEDLVEKALENVIYAQGDSSLIPKQIEVSWTTPPSAPGHLVNISYELFPTKLNFDLEAVKKAASEEINPYLTWHSRFSLGITNSFQVYTEWYPLIYISFSFPEHKAYFCHTGFKDTPEFKCTLDLADSETETLIAAIKEGNRLRVEFNKTYLQQTKTLNDYLDLSSTFEKGLTESTNYKQDEPSLFTYPLKNPPL